MIQQTSVPRALETKTRLFGFELGDLLLIFMYLSVSNLFFGETRLKLPMVWGGTLLIAGVLYFIKRNKPDDHLRHLGEYTRKPKLLSAGEPDTEYSPYLKGDENE